MSEKTKGQSTKLSNMILETYTKKYLIKIWLLNLAIDVCWMFWKGGGSTKNHTPCLIASVIKKTPRVIFEKHFYFHSAYKNPQDLLVYEVHILPFLLLSVKTSEGLWVLVSTVLSYGDGKEAKRMKKARVTGGKKEKIRGRPALTPEAREKQLVALAVNLAESQLREGTASSQVISHFLKLGSTTAQIEKEMLLKQTELVGAKTEALQSAKQIEALYSEAMEAMRCYSGQGGSYED